VEKWSRGTSVAAAGDEEAPKAARTRARATRASGASIMCELGRIGSGPSCSRQLARATLKSNTQGPGLIGVIMAAQWKLEQPAMEPKRAN